MEIFLIYIYNNIFNISYLDHLQINIKESPDEDPQFEVVEGPVSSDPPEECFKVKCPLFVINAAVQAGPGTDSEGGGRGGRAWRYETDCG